MHEIWIELFTDSSHLREIVYYEGILLKIEKIIVPITAHY